MVKKIDIIVKELSLDLTAQGFNLTDVIGFLWGGCFDEIIINEIIFSK